MKKFSSIILLIAMCITFCACSRNTPTESTTINSSTSNSTTSQHIHNWSIANCINPQTCIDCGVTEGDLADHDWNPATYSQPKTCKNCGLSEGEPLIPGITIGGTQVFINSAGGVIPYIYWRNDSGKDIKNITFTAVPYNAVGDIVASSIDNRTYMDLQVTGPIPPVSGIPAGALKYIIGGTQYFCFNLGGRVYYQESYNKDITLTESEYKNIFPNSYWDIIWYNNTIRYIAITKVYVEYMDGSTETIIDPIVASYDHHFLSY